MNSAAENSRPRPGVFAWPWYPFVAAAYPLWFIYFGNPGQVSVVSALAATALAFAVVAVLLWTAIRLTRSRHVGAGALTLVILAFFSYGAVHDLAVRVAADPTTPTILGPLFDMLGAHAVLTPVMLLLCAALVYLVVKRVGADSERLTGACNFAATALVAIMLARFAMADRGGHELRTVAAAPTGMSGREVSVLGYNPDIYYIIVDGYARADVLRHYYGFDNSEFLAGLGQRGFAVNDSSQANYYWTVLSLASSLNYSYLQDIAAPVLAAAEAARGPDGYDQVQRMVQDNRAAQFLRARGYRFVHIRSSTPPTLRNPYADEEVGCDGGLFDEEYFRTLAEISWLQAAGELASTDLAQCHRMRLKSLGDQAHKAGPKFVFAHFLPPHHPYLFDRNGNVLRHVTVSNQFDFQARLWEDRQAYLEQVMYTNRTLLEVVDRILAESERPPVIIVQSDHGPNLRNGLSGDERLALRLANFAAYLLPGARDVLPRDCAPVNQFRYLFNHYFDAGLPILPHHSYYSEYGSPLRLREVSVKSSTGKSS